jgi:H+/Cl- antiporter ClcA
MTILKRLDNNTNNKKIDKDEEVSMPFLDRKSSTYAYQKLRQSQTSSYYGLTESHQYEQDESDVWRHHQLLRHFEDKGHWFTFAKKRDIQRWTITLTTGFFCGLIACFVTVMTRYFTYMKFNYFNYLIEKEKNEEIIHGVAFFYLVVSNFFFVSLAWITVYIDPLASGSGIPEIKCFLNGLNIPGVLKFKTLIWKIIGIVFACAGGLPLGKEGPMIHAGAITASIVSQGKSKTFASCSKRFNSVQDFRNDKENRDFVAIGAAAGVGAAFGAPVGGVLFSIEEGASFWSTKLTWRCFFCAMTTVGTVYIITTANSQFGHSENRAMFSFGEFDSLYDGQSNYSVWEISLFLVLGLIGGLLGAIFIYINTFIFKIRKQYQHNNFYSWLEIVIISTLMSLLTFIIPALWNKCTPLPLANEMIDWNNQERNLVKLLVPLYCPSDTHYNELASLYLTDSDTAIKQLFHFREDGNKEGLTFSLKVLALFFIPYFCMACLTLGSKVPAGIFVPSLLSGAAFGRYMGHLLHLLDKTNGTFADAGTYALMGAAAITGGVTRMTISLTVMILEATGDMQYVIYIYILFYYF